MQTVNALLAYRKRLEEARYAGLRRVRDSSGEEIEYRSDAELSRAMSALDAEIAKRERQPASRVLPVTSKGI